MKKLPVFLSVILFTLPSFSQNNIELKFSSSYYGNWIPSDSIKIENQSRNCDTVLYGQDTTLFIEFPSGLNEVVMNQGYDFRLIQNHPNPFCGQTEVGLYLFENDHISITISDIAGRAVSFYEQNLGSGFHTFTFIPGNAKAYFCHVSGTHQSKSIKMLHTGKESMNISCKLIYNAESKPPLSLKMHKGFSGFTFLPGDTMKYTGYAMTPNSLLQQDNITDIPLGDTFYRFQITEGIPCPGIPEIVYEGQVYHSVLIGDQCWLKENLNVGTMIPLTEWQTDNGLIEKYCYNDDTSLCAVYGGFYQWDEMFFENNGICPDGWHVPSDEEWETLFNMLGGMDVAGGKMKEPGTVHWKSPNTGATNISGFTALPAGAAAFIGSGFWRLGEWANFWSTTSHSSYGYGRFTLRHDHEDVMAASDQSHYGNSVRCLRN